jgi:DNA-binding XRE family transcriptional regulator
MPATTAKNPELSLAFSRAVRAARQERGVTQEDLAYSAAIDRACMSRLETGQRHPSLDMVFRIAVTLNMEPAELVQQISKEY